MMIQAHAPPPAGAIGGGDGGGAARGLNPSRAPMAVPDLAPRQRLLVLQRIMRDQAAFLAAKTMPSEDFGSNTLNWYWESSDKRTRNLEYMYRAILNYCLNRVPLQDKRIINALVRLCESPLKDPAMAQTRFGLPNWFTSTLLLWMTLRQFQKPPSPNPAVAAAAAATPAPAAAAAAAAAAAGRGGGGSAPAAAVEGPAGGDERRRGGGKGEGKEGDKGDGGGGDKKEEGGGSKANREIFSPFVRQQCRPQVVTLLNILTLQLEAEEFLYIKLEGRTSRLWVSRSGLPALPTDVLLAITRFVRVMFDGDMEVGRLALKAEKTTREVVAERGRGEGSEGGVSSA